MRISFLLLLLLVQSEIFAKEILVKNTEALHAAVKTVQPGDVIVMANGTWNNAELLFEANGTAASPLR